MNNSLPLYYHYSPWVCLDQIHKMNLGQVISVEKENENEFFSESSDGSDSGMPTLRE